MEGLRLQHMEGPPAVSKTRSCDLDLGQGLTSGEGGWMRRMLRRGGGHWGEGRGECVTQIPFSAPVMD